jgi:hypothetical protein
MSSLHYNYNFVEARELEVSVLKSGIAQRDKKRSASQSSLYSLIFVVNISQCVDPKNKTKSSVFSIKFFFYFNFKSIIFTTVG